MKEIKLYSANGTQESLSNVFGDKTMKFKLEIEVADKTEYLKITKNYFSCVKPKSKNEIMLLISTEKVTAIEIGDLLNRKYLVIEE